MEMGMQKVAKGPPPQRTYEFGSCTLKNKHDGVKSGYYFVYVVVCLNKNKRAHKKPRKHPSTKKKFKPLSITAGRKKEEKKRLSLTS
jgi:hypothetical protein